MELSNLSLELTTDVSGLTFETFYLRQLLRKSAVASVKNWLEYENREDSFESELYRLESSWITCIDFFIDRFDPALQKTLHNSIKYRQLASPTGHQQPLPNINISHEIILLVLQPSLDPSKPIKCNRCRSSLEQQPCLVYDVLSYAWEDPRETKRILIDGIPFKLQKSLESALRHLRLPNALRMLWIDALCVVGRDVQSWGHDVERLKPIYANAREILIWLGNESNTSGLAFAFLEKYVAIPEKQRDRSLPITNGWDTFPGGFNNHLELKCHGLIPVLFREKRFLRYLDAILNLMCRPWWDRAGLLQELMGGGKVMVWCGTKSVSWDVFASFFQKLHEQSLNISPEHAEQRTLQIPYLIPIGSVGYFPSLRRANLGKELTGIIEALSSSLERTFMRSNLATAWTLALTRMGAYFGSFMTHIALKISRDDFENRQASISKIFGILQPSFRVGALDSDHIEAGRQHYSDDKTRLIDALKKANSGINDLLASNERQSKPSDKVNTPSTKDQFGLKEAFPCWETILKRFGANGTTSEGKSSKDQIGSDLDKQSQASVRIPALLSLCPSDDPGLEVLCNIIPVDIAALSALGIENGPHCALSHLSKDEKSTDIICLDGNRTQVSSALANVLKGLRRTDLPVLVYMDMNDAYDGTYKQADEIRFSRSMHSMAGHFFIYGHEHDASYFNLPTAETDLASKFLQRFGSPQRHSIEQELGVIPIILPSYKPEVDYANDVKKYPYHVLPTTTSIRLLTVLPLDPAEVEEDKYSLIRCSMSIVDLEDSPKYDALSYTWGDPIGMCSTSQKTVPQSQWYMPTFEIECDGQLISISANLYTALIAIRRMISKQDNPVPEQEMQSRLHTGSLWIDAICINQADLDERSQQVGLMSRIYRQAVTVFAWLGGEDDLIRDALEVIYLLIERSIRGFDVSDRIRSSGMSILDDRTYQVLGLPRIWMRQWIALYAFLSRTWFSRAWVVQEVCLAKTIMILCGHTSLPWDLFLLAMRMLHQSNWLKQVIEMGLMATISEDSPMTIPSAICPLRKSQPTSEISANIWIIVDVKSSLGTGEAITSRPDHKPYQLVTTVSMFRAAQAMDPRDKIYAFMSISSEFLSDRLISEGSTLTPNYRLSPREVFIESSKFMLLSSPNLELLSLVQETDRERIQDLPSWVPDFSARDTPVPLNFGFPSPFTAADGLGSAYRAFPSLGVLEVRGICVGTLVCVGTFELGTLLSRLADIVSQVPPLSTIYGPRMTEKFKEFILGSERHDREHDRVASPQAIDSSCTLEHQSRFEVLWRAILADSSPNRRLHPLPKDFGVGMRVVFRQIVNKLQVQARNAVLKKQPDAAEHLDHLAREHTALQQLLGEVPQEAPHILPPEFQQFLEAFRATESASHGTAAQQHDRMMKRQMDVVDDNLIEDIRISNFLPFKSVFRTSAGQVGRGAIANRVDDEVWVLAGGNVPFILRNVGEGRYKLIGECYVHGIMHGEAVVADTLKKLRTIHIV
ncbi:heterokaryon incompatibility protein-domain-containing protein [Xylaria cf. heliscus]|nr:heterokaryon incompatibility protein-domain-containing protein [Xylaria cf. heliscus]